MYGLGLFGHCHSWQFDCLTWMQSTVRNGSMRSGRWGVGGVGAVTEALVVLHLGQQSVSIDSIC